MASAISSAIIVYKKEYFRTQSNRNSDELPSRKTTENGIKDSSKNSKLKRIVEKQPAQKGELRRQNSDVVFKVQFEAGNKNNKLNPPNFRGLKNVALEINDGYFYKYPYSSTLDYNSAKEDLKEVKSKGYSFA
jgi:N-acetylmuramoyl-L-alanine amidase